MPWKAFPIKTDAVANHVNRLVIPTQNQPNHQIHAILVQALPTNTGRIVFGDKSNIVAQPVGGNILAMLPPPTTNIYPSCNAGIPFSPAGLDLIDIYWCVEAGGDGFSISYLS